MAERVGDGQKAYTIVHAAVVADLSEKTLRRAMGSGALRAKRIGRAVRILDHDLQEWLEARPDV